MAQKKTPYNPSPRALFLPYLPDSHNQTLGNRLSPKSILIMAYFASATFVLRPLSSISLEHQNLYLQALVAKGGVQIFFGKHNNEASQIDIRINERTHVLSSRTSLRPHVSSTPLPPRRRSCPHTYERRRASMALLASAVQAEWRTAFRPLRSGNQTTALDEYRIRRLAPSISASFIGKCLFKHSDTAEIKKRSLSRGRERMKDATVTSVPSRQTFSNAFGMAFSLYQKLRRFGISMREYRLGEDVRPQISDG